MDRFAGFACTEIASVPVLWRRDPRVKTFRVALYARRPLDHRAAARGLLPELLLEGTERAPSRAALLAQMERLYGCAAVPGAGKHGESHVLQVLLDSVAGRFLPGVPDQLADGLALLRDVLHAPRRQGIGFPHEVFARRQRNQMDSVRAEFDNKAVYARRQALALACEGEPMAIPEHGGLAAIAALDRGAPEQARHDFLTHGELVLLGGGAIDDDFAERVAAWLAHLPPRQPEKVAAPAAIAPRPARHSLEHADIQQAKFWLVFRFPQAPGDPWPARRLFANLLGGGPHARLFKEVRERRSLAYTVHAEVDHRKGLLLVSAGLDAGAAREVEDLVQRELGALARGEFSAQELATSTAGIVSSLRAVDDAVASRMAFTYERLLDDIDREPSAQAEVYARASADEVAKSAAGLWLDHTYLLAPRRPTTSG
jgi:predicted Zn-dependent peptidase